MLNRRVTLLFCSQCVLFALFLFYGCGGGGGGSSGPPPTSALYVNATTYILGNTATANATGVDPNSTISAWFSEDVEATTLNATTVYVKDNSGNLVQGIVGMTGQNRDQVIFTPANQLEFSTTYTCTVTNGVVALTGDLMQSNYSWSFTTRPDNMPPVVMSTAPIYNGTLPINSALTASFNEDLMPSSINNSTFLLLDQNGNPVSGTVSMSGTKTAMFTPAPNTVAAGYTYTATLTTGIKDIGGNAMADNYSWPFQTTGTSNTPPSLLSEWPTPGEQQC